MARQRHVFRCYAITLTAIEVTSSEVTAGHIVSRGEDETTHRGRERLQEITHFRIIDSRICRAAAFVTVNPNKVGLTDGYASASSPHEAILCQSVVSYSSSKEKRGHAIRGLAITIESWI